MSARIVINSKKFLAPVAQRDCLFELQKRWENVVRNGRFTLSFAVLLFASSCGAGTSQESPRQAASGSVDTKDKEVARMTTDSPKSVVQPPSPSSILYLIFQKDGDGATSYEVENGSWATYWYGYSFDLGGKHYFTGFASQTPDKYGNQAAEDSPAPDAKVTISQATLVTTNPDAEKPWTFQGSDQFVGEFGGYEKANEIDATREPVSQETKDGKLVVAIPTWYLASGTRVSAYDVFVFNPHELTRTDERRWTYLGNLVSGEDNGAACDEAQGAAVPCVKSTGELSFIEFDGNGLPGIRIAVTGTEIEGPGKVRTAGPDDVVEYRYDAAAKQYR